MLHKVTDPSEPRQLFTCTRHQVGANSCNPTQSQVVEDGWNQFWDFSHSHPIMTAVLQDETNSLWVCLYEGVGKGCVTSIDVADFTLIGTEIYVHLICTVCFLCAIYINIVLVFLWLNHPLRWPQWQIDYPKPLNHGHITLELSHKWRAS